MPSDPSALAAIPGVIVWPLPLVALVAFAIGIVLTVRGRVGLGVTVMVTALVVPIVIAAVAVKPYRVPSESMAPTLAVGQRVAADRLSSPSVGEIVVFHAPQGAGSLQATCGNPRQGAGNQQACDQPAGGESSVIFIKRIVAGPGDVISIRDGHVTRNGKAQKDSYTRPCASFGECTFPAPIKIPAGDWFMLGDNRGQSSDSRFWGPVPGDWIIGSVFATYWPLDQLGTL